MRSLNLHTCLDLQALPLETLVEHFGSFGATLYN
ncbi:hypothetical protein [Candidatus Coxiella mudrowiae]